MHSGSVGPRRRPSRRKNPRFFSSEPFQFFGAVTTVE
jgi:hypothetical protein